MKHTHFFRKPNKKVKRILSTSIMFAWVFIAAFSPGSFLSWFMWVSPLFFFFFFWFPSFHFPNCRDLFLCSCCCLFFFLACFFLCVFLSVFSFSFFFLSYFLPICLFCVRLSFIRLLISLFKSRYMLFAFIVLVLVHITQPCFFIYLMFVGCSRIRYQTRCSLT